jgi:hypothetical protein
MLYTIEFLGAVVGPAKANGARWDGVGHVDPAAMGELSTLLIGANPLPAVTAFVARQAASGTEPPDPFGYVVPMSSEGAPPWKLSLASKQNNRHDTFTPVFSGPPAFVGVPLDPSVRIRVVLYDEDVDASDAIGVAELTYSDLMGAVAAGTVVPVNVSAQTANQLLFVNISVRETPSVEPRVVGETF